MSYYSRVDRRTWGDEKFRHFSDRAKLLWFRLLSGPELTTLPGLIVAGRAQLAEALGWTPEAFLEAFQEAFQQGMVKADWTARVIWLPNATRYNRPESPNVVRSWRAHFDNVPECELKTEAFKVLKAFAEGLGEGFGKAFREAFPKGMPNQEQQQKQQSVAPAATRTRQKAKREKQPPKPRERDPLFDAVAEVTGSSPGASGAYIAKVCRSLRQADPPFTPEEVRRWAVQESQRCGWTTPPTLPQLERDINRVRVNPVNPPEDDREEKARRQMEERRQEEERRKQPPLTIAGRRAEHNGTGGEQ